MGQESNEHDLKKLYSYEEVPNFLLKAKRGEAFLPAETSVRQLSAQFPLVLLILGKKRDVQWPDRSQLIIAEQSAGPAELLCFLKCKLLSEEGGKVELGFTGKTPESTDPVIVRLTCPENEALFPVSVRP